MNSATGSESTPTRRIWTSRSRPHTATSGTARAASRTNWPKRPIAQLAHALARHAQHAADLLERVLAPAVQAEIESQHLGIPSLQRVEGRLDLIRQEAIHRLVFGVGQVLSDEALDQRAVAVGIERGVEPNVPRVERGERLHHLERQLGGVGDLLGRGLAAQRLPQVLGRANDARQVRRPVERHAHGAPLARQRGEDRLPDPPDGVGDELHALIGVELARRREQPDVALADQVREREAAVLVLLGHGDDEAQVALDELLHRFLVAGADLAGERDLLLLREERRLRHLVEVLIEDVAFVLVVGEPGEQTPAPPALARGLGHRRGDGGRGGRMTGRRPPLRPGGGGGRLPANVLGHSYVSDRTFIPATGRKVQVRAQLRLTLTQRPDKMPRSEEHTSELQSLAYLVCRLLLEKKNK